MINIKITGIDKAIRHLENYKRLMNQKMRTLLEKLAEIGIDTASVRFSAAQYDGANDVIVDSVPQWEGENKLAIIARGKAVAFIEFGTGVHYVEQHPTAEKVGAIRGAFGQGKGSRDRWAYYGEPGTNGYEVRDGVVLTHGNPPARAMYDAGKEIRDRIAETAKEVFDSG